MDDEELIAVLTRALEEREGIVAASQAMFVEAVSARNRVRDALACLLPVSDPDVASVVPEPPAMPAAETQPADVQPAQGAVDLAEVARVANEALAAGRGLAGARRAVRTHFRVPGQRAWRLIDHAIAAGHEIHEPAGEPGTVPDPVIRGLDPLPPEPEPEPEPAVHDGTHYYGDGCDHPHGRAEPAEVVPIRPLPDDFTPASEGRHFECVNDECVYLRFGTTRELTSHTVSAHGRPPTSEEKTAIEPRPTKGGDHAEHAVST